MWLSHSTAADAHRTHALERVCRRQRLRLFLSTMDAACLQDPTSVRVAPLDALHSLSRCFSTPPVSTKLRSPTLCAGAGAIACDTVCLCVNAPCIYDTTATASAAVHELARVLDEGEPTECRTKRLGLQRPRYATWCATQHRKKIRLLMTASVNSPVRCGDRPSRGLWSLEHAPNALFSRERFRSKRSDGSESHSTTTYIVHRERQ